jgi:hypothetical protein
MNAADVVGYSYDADHHCTYCAAKRFGNDLDKPETTDSEGNPVHAMFAGDESEYELSCGDCREPIESQVINMGDES